MGATVSTSRAPEQSQLVLPHEVTINIMHRLTVRERLQAGLASRVLQAAARDLLSTTEAIQIVFSTQDKLRQFEKYLRNSPLGQHLVSIDLSVPESMCPDMLSCHFEERLLLQHLPCPQLLSLKLQGFELQLRPSSSSTNSGSSSSNLRSVASIMQRLGLSRSSSTGASNSSSDVLLSVATRLTRLELRSCVVPGLDDALQPLAVLTGLQHLVLEHMIIKKSRRRIPRLGEEGRKCAGGEHTFFTKADLPRAWIPGLTQLTHISFAGLFPEDMDQISELPALKELRLVEIIEVPEDACEITDVISGLQSLTLLHLEDRAVDERDKIPFNLSYTPGLFDLTNLQHLRMCFAHTEEHDEDGCLEPCTPREAARFDQKLLAKLPQLRFVDVSGVSDRQQIGGVGVHICGS